MRPWSEWCWFRLSCISWGQWNWWSPAPLARLHQRFGISESAPEKEDLEPDRPQSVARDHRVAPRDQRTARNPRSEHRIQRRGRIRELPKHAPEPDHLRSPSHAVRRSTTYEALLSVANARDWFGVGPSSPARNIGLPKQNSPTASGNLTWTANQESENQHHRFPAPREAEHRHHRRRRAISGVIVLHVSEIALG